MKEYPNFHGIENAFVIRVVEGKGTTESVAREVLYVYDENLYQIGKIDNHPNKSVGE
jgi:hypothetical protein